MTDLVQLVLGRYGSTAAILREGEEAVQVRAFVEPVSEKNWSAYRAVRELGEYPQGRYVYIGPPQPAPGDGDTVQCGGKEYIVVRAETLQLAGRVVYVWALLREKGGAEPWRQ